MAFSSFSSNSENRWLVTVSDDATACLWDLNAPDPAATAVVLRGHTGPIWAVTITSDDHWLITSSDDGTIRFWNLQPEVLIELAEPIISRNLTWEEWQLYFPNRGYNKTYEDLPDPPDLP